MKSLFLGSTTLSLLLLSSCTTLQKTSDSTASAMASDKATCHEDQTEVEQHSITEIKQHSFQNEIIYQYQNYYFSKLEPKVLQEFIQKNSIKIAIDFRESPNEKEIPENFSAVYWANPLENPENWDSKSANIFFGHLEAFSDQSTIFISKNGEAPVIAFLSYWAQSKSLTNSWVEREAEQMGLKNKKLLYQWIESTEVEEDEDRRAPASDSKNSNDTQDSSRYFSIKSQK